jgi:hypothetical protein
MDWFTKDGDDAAYSTQHLLVVVPEDAEHFLVVVVDLRCPFQIKHSFATRHFFVSCGPKNSYFGSIFIFFFMECLRLKGFL